MTDKKSKLPNLEKLTFEEAIAKLREIVEQVESGEVGLEDSIEQYELGCRLIQHCRSILDGAEQRIEVLTKTLDGKLAAQAAPQELQGEAGEE
ncbi:MAG: exodeoxyribonuclease VII small subunit [Phycisphaerae bacterium]|mgnify:CR=1 FL=1|nr:exodeoxyribonuclease VII small subunit [Phycisphaerae bacterium]